MPAFDPVRDAVLNSPNNQSYHVPSPSLGRRATDLSSLLNDDSRPPVVTPSLSHLLHSTAVAVEDDDDDDKLARSQPLRRVPGSTVNIGDDVRHSGYPRPPSPSNSRPSSSSSSVQFPPLTPRSTVSPTMAPPPLPTVSSVPYNPRNRKTPAASVLIPMSQSEMKTYKTYVGKGAARLMKRKRSAVDEPDDQPPSKRRAGDTGIVVDHYNSRPEVGVVQRQDSPIIGLKNFNNWVKSVLISRFAHPILTSSPSYGPGRGKGRVLDMGCGKGGDITKWAKARVKEMICADIADVSVDQARSRWQALRGHRFDASFAALDCYTEPLTDAFPPSIFSNPFDVVTMQFCMHYAFETEEKARRMLDNVSRWLRPGGVFIGTIPNAEQLLEHLDELPPQAKDLSFGNAVYQIRFESRANRPVFGHKYWFFLKDAVEDVPEYLVRWDNFVQLAAEYHLRPKYKAEFHEVFNENQEHPEYGPLLLRMKVVDENGESAMDEDQWEAANIYIAFALEKW